MGQGRIFANGKGGSSLCCIGPWQCPLHVTAGVWWWGPALLSEVGISVLTELCYERRGEGRGGKWLSGCCSSGASRKHYSLPLLCSCWEAAASAAGPVSGKSSILHQLSKRRERERGGESRIEEEPPRPRLPLDISLTAARKELETANLLFPIQEQWLLCTNYTNNRSIQWFYRTQTSARKLVFVLDTM